VVTCQIEPPADIDTFQFAGTAGEVITILVSRHSGPGGPCVELFDPMGQRIAGEQCRATGARIDVQLGTTGDHTIRVSEQGNDETVAYRIDLQCLGQCPVSEEIPPLLDPGRVVPEVVIFETRPFELGRTVVPNTNRNVRDELAQALTQVVGAPVEIRQNQDGTVGASAPGASASALPVRVNFATGPRRQKAAPAPAVDPVEGTFTVTTALGAQVTVMAAPPGLQNLLSVLVGLTPSTTPQPTTIEVRPGQFLVPEFPRPARASPSAWTSACSRARRAPPPSRSTRTRRSPSATAPGRARSPSRSSPTCPKC
jgi:hypothetical protein